MRARLGGEDWRDVRLALARQGRDAQVTSKFASGGTQRTELWFEIWVPRHTDVDLTSAGGSVEIDQLIGSFSGTTGGGTIRVHDATGKANLSTGGGDIVISDTHLGGTISTGWGAVRIQNNSGDLRAFSSKQGATIRPGRSDSVWNPRPPAWPIDRETHETSITNRNGSCVALSVGDFVSEPVYVVDGMPITAAGPVSISKPGGSIEIASAPAGATVSTGGGRIVIDSSDKSVVASTGGGDVELRATSGNAVASTGAGSVSIRVVGSHGTSHNINVCHGRGRVTLELPADIDATFELETAYTDNHPNPTTIDSDFGLARTETHEWDDRYGTPRKFVRATGTIGSGANLIRITTVNGDSSFAAADRRGFPMGTARQDLQHALRAIRRTPALSVVVTLALALGIGATTALFGVVNVLFLRPLPYMSPAALVRVFDVQGDVHQLPASFPEYGDWLQRTSAVFSDVGAFLGQGEVLSGSGDAEQLLGAMVTPNLPAMLGLKPLLGRTFRADEDGAGQTHVVVLSEGLWPSASRRTAASWARRSR